LKTRGIEPILEGELRRIAHHYMRKERSGHTLQTTALVNEAYLRLVDQAQVVELRYFGGLSVEEAAEVLGVHPNTVIRDWSLAKTWLTRELGPQSPHAA